MLKKYIGLILLTGPFILGQISSDGNISISALGDLSISSQDTAFRSHGLEIVIMGKIKTILPLALFGHWARINLNYIKKR